MAVRAERAGRRKAGGFLSESMRFRRQDGRVGTKKIQRKIRLKSRHIFTLFILTLGLFFAGHKIYLFLISWEGMNIRGVEITGAGRDIKEDVKHYLARANLGNLLLLDIGRLREILGTHRWIEEVRIRKVLPPTLRIEIKERRPAAVLKTEIFTLIDKEGVPLLEIEPEIHADLPLIITGPKKDEKDYREKINLAWKCLESLEAHPDTEVEEVDIVSLLNVRVRLKGSSTRLLFGHDRFEEKYASFRSYRKKLEALGPLDYVDLRFDDRFYFKPLEGRGNKNISGQEKEAD